jgi:hypothetical protein
MEFVRCSLIYNMYIMCTTLLLNLINIYELPAIYFLVLYYIFIPIIVIFNYNNNIIYNIAKINNWIFLLKILNPYKNIVYFPKVI